MLTTDQWQRLKAHEADPVVRNAITMLQRLPTDTVEVLVETIAVMAEQKQLTADLMLRFTGLRFIPTTDPPGIKPWSAPRPIGDPL